MQIKTIQTTTKAKVDGIKEWQPKLILASTCIWTGVHISTHKYSHPHTHITHTKNNTYILGYRDTSTEIYLI